MTKGVHMTTKLASDTLQLGDPVEHRGVVIAPLFPRRQPVAEYLTVEEALPLGSTRRLPGAATPEGRGALGRALQARRGAVGRLARGARKGGETQGRFA